ncbi:MBOAT family protein [bacterium 1XD42-8]|nr:MBOAT family protein [bacterium 1XD42-8]
MVFSSLLFIFRFMIIFYLIYYIAPIHLRNLILLIGSLIFYAWGEPRYLILILLSIFINFCLGKGIEKYWESKKKLACLMGAVLYNIGMLFLFKYAGFFIDMISVATGKQLPTLEMDLPLGISFYTFQILSYVVDVYKGSIQAETSIIRLGTYLCMFPQLIAGPIVIYKDVETQMRKRKYCIENFEEGLKEFSIGLASKVLLANQIGYLWSELEQAGYQGISTLAAWLGVLAFTLQIYFDFFGYSKMAVGLGKMLGFQLPQNFDYPYISRSATEFWRRWHITLGAWFREYLYVPLGGNRKGRTRTYMNLLVVWSVTGLWHGASWNFVLWGVYFYIFISLEKLYLKKWLDRSNIASRVYALLIIGLGWIIFALTDFKDMKNYFSTLFSLTGGSDWIYYIRNYGLLLVMGIIFSTPILRKWYEKQKDKWIGISAVFLLFWASIYFLVDTAYNPFLYFRF